MLAVAEGWLLAGFRGRFLNFHRIIKVGKNLQDHQTQLITQAM